MSNHQTLPMNRWSLPRFKALSEDAKVLLFYLSTNSQYSSLPPLSLKDVSQDLQWTNQRTTRKLCELISHRLISLTNNNQEFYIKPYFCGRLLDKPFVISKAASTAEKPSSWREIVRAKLYGNILQKQQSNNEQTELEPPRILHWPNRDLDEVDYVYLLENQAPGKSLREILSLHCQVAISIAFEMLFTDRSIDCTGFDTDKLAFRRDEVNRHLDALIPIKPSLCIHLRKYSGRTDDFIAASMGLRRQDYRQLKFIFFNEPELSLEIEANSITIARAYQKAKAQQKQCDDNSRSTL